jgi:hypothetical protein
VCILRRREKNLIVDAGLELLMYVIESAVPTRPSHMAIGDDNTASAASMTALQGTEHQRVALDSTTRVGKTLSYAATLGGALGADKSVGEFGIFNDAAAGTMLARFVTAIFTLNDGGELDVTWEFTMET